jgi:hypothetical protein
MLRRDTAAAFESTGAWIFRRYRFASGKLQSPKSLSVASYRRLEASQQDVPVVLLDPTDRKKRWWWFRDEFYWEDESLGAVEVKALILERLGQQQRRVQRAVALMDQTSPQPSSTRDVVPEAIRLEVWRRDAGRCVQCGSKRRLQFDHVIPVHLGGASTVANLQLLCSDCNQAKGAALG